MRAGAWALVSEKTREPMVEGAEVTTFRGEVFTLNGGRPPQHEGSTGRVWVQVGEAEVEYFPSVIGAKWVEISALEEMSSTEGEEVRHG